MRLALHEGLFVVGEIWAKYIRPIQISLIRAFVPMLILLAVLIMMIMQTVGLYTTKKLAKYKYEDGAITKYCVERYGKLECNW